MERTNGKIVATSVMMAVIVLAIALMAIFGLTAPDSVAKAQNVPEGVELWVAGVDILAAGTVSTETAGVTKGTASVVCDGNEFFLTIENFAYSGEGYNGSAIYFKGTEEYNRLSISVNGNCVFEGSSTNATGIITLASANAALIIEGGRIIDNSGLYLCGNKYGILTSGGRSSISFRTAQVRIEADEAAVKMADSEEWFEIASDSAVTLLGNTSAVNGGRLFLENGGQAWMSPQGNATSLEATFYEASQIESYKKITTMRRLQTGRTYLLGSTFEVGAGTYVVLEPGDEPTLIDEGEYTVGEPVSLGDRVAFQNLFKCGSYSYDLILAKVSDEQVIGFACTDGEGTQQNPYTFAVYDGTSSGGNDPQVGSNYDSLAVTLSDTYIANAPWDSTSDEGLDFPLDDLTFSPDFPYDLESADASGATLHPSNPEQSRSAWLVIHISYTEGGNPALEALFDKGEDLSVSFNGNVAEYYSEQPQESMEVHGYITDAGNILFMRQSNNYSLQIVIKREQAQGGSQSGGNDPQGGDPTPATHTHNDVTFTPWESATSLPTEAGNYYLTADVTLSSSWNVPAGETNLCLNGHGIKVTGVDSVIYIASGRTLNVYDCGDTVHYFDRDGTNRFAINIDETEGSGRNSFVGGYIAGGKGKDNQMHGGGVYVNGTFNLYGGNIIGNTLTASDNCGAGVYCNENSIFRMYGGSISYNYAQNAGCAIFGWKNCSIEIHGGEISYNKTNWSSGSAISFWNPNGYTVSLKLYGGFIHDNSSHGGEGAVNLVTGSPTVGLKGGLIVQDNTTDSTAGNAALNVYVGTNPINIEGELSSDAKICIRLSSGTGVLTSGWSDYMEGENPSDYFVSDAEGLYFILNQDGEVEITDVAPAVPHVHDGVTFEAWTSATSLPTSAGNYYLTQDVTLTSTWSVPSGTTNLCLNGYGIILGSDRIITVRNSGATLNLYDCGSTVHYYDVDAEGMATNVNDVAGEDRQSFIGGYITGGVYGGGGAIWVENATFNMYGGTILGNSASVGGGVYVSESTGTINLHGGKIMHNKATRASEGGGGGVYVAYGATFNMYGGEMSYNYTANNGGGVALPSGTFRLFGGTIAHNVAAGNGGGIYKQTSSRKMYLSGAPVVEDNTAGGAGNDLYINVAGDVLNISGDLTQGATIGVALSGGTGVFTSGWSTYMAGAIPADYFYSENGDYQVYLLDGEAAILAEAPQVPHVHDGVTFTAWESATSLPTSAGNYYLTADVTLTLTWNVPSGTTNLCLNGYGIKMTSGNNSVITVGSGAVLNVYDCGDTTHYFDVHSNGYATDINDVSGSNSFTGGYITGGQGTDLGGNRVLGGGFFVNGGTLHMYGGTVIGNYMTREFVKGAGVWVGYNGTFIMEEGAYIKYNWSDNVGGGVGVGAITDLGNSSGTFVMNGGEISHNRAATGGGIILRAGEIALNGGTVAYNSARDSGGAIDYEYQSVSTLKISGDPVINNNSIYSANGTGDNVVLRGNTIPKIVLTGALTSGANIHLMVGHGFPPTATEGVFTSGWSTYMAGAIPADYFYSENGDYQVYLLDGEAAILAEDPNAPAVTLGTGLLYVGGEDIVTAEKYTVKGNGGGTAVLSEDEQGNLILTLTNYVYTGAGYDSYQGGAIDYHPGYSDCRDLTILLVGENSITKSNDNMSCSYGIYFKSSEHTLIIDGTGSLTISFDDSNRAGQNTKSNGIFCEPGAFVMNGGSVVSNGGRAVNESAGIYADNGITFNGGSFTGKGYYTTKYQSRGIYASWITINGGTVIGTAPLDNPKDARAFDNSTLTINAGTVTAYGNPSFSSTYNLKCGTNSTWIIFAGEDEASATEVSSINGNSKYVHIVAQSSGAHAHDYETAWTTDDVGHWHACVGEGECDAPYGDYGEHSYSDDISDVAYYTCSVCHYENASRKGKYEEAQQQPEHIHSWTYGSATADAMTATCTEAGCPDGYDVNGITLTIHAPADLVCDGTPKEATITGNYPDPAPEGLDTYPAIRYCYFEGKTQIFLNGAPTEAGSYQALFTWGGYTAYVEFDLAQWTSIAVASITVDGETTEYNSLIEAYEACPEGGTIVLIENVDISNSGDEVYVTVEKDLNIDLHGHTLQFKYTLTSAQIILSGGHVLTIDNSVPEKGGVKGFIDVADDGSYVLLRNCRLIFAKTGLASTADINHIAPFFTVENIDEDGFLSLIRPMTDDELVELTEELIDEIPDPPVNNDETKDAIDEARKVYDMLPEDKKGEVENRQKLFDAEDAYARLHNVKWRITMKVKQATSYADAIIGALAEDEKVVRVYDVTLWRIAIADGEAQDPESAQPSDMGRGATLTVKLTIPDALLGKAFRILHVHAADDLAFVDYTIDEEGTHVTIRDVDRLSEFVFVAKEADLTPSGQGGEQGQSGEGQSGEQGQGGQGQGQSGEQGQGGEETPTVEFEPEITQEDDPTIDNWTLTPQGGQGQSGQGQSGSQGQGGSQGGQGQGGQGSQGQSGEQGQGGQPSVPQQPAVTVGLEDTEPQPGITVEVEVKTEVSEEVKESENKALDLALQSDDEIAVVYEVKLIRTTVENGVEIREEIQPSDIKPGTVVVINMLIPDNLRGKPFRLLHIHSEEDIKEVSYTVSEDGTTATVRVDRLSEFAFVGKAAEEIIEPNKLSDGAIAGIVIGGSLGTLLIGLVIYFLLKRSKDDAEEAASSKEPKAKRERKGKKQAPVQAAKPSEKESALILAATVAVEEQNVGFYRITKDPEGKCTFALFYAEGDNLSKEMGVFETEKDAVLAIRVLRELGKGAKAENRVRNAALDLPAPKFVLDVDAAGVYRYSFLDEEGAVRLQSVQYLNEKRCLVDLKKALVCITTETLIGVDGEAKGDTIEAVPESIAAEAVPAEVASAEETPAETVAEEPVAEPVEEKADQPVEETAEPIAAEPVEEPVNEQPTEVATDAVSLKENIAVAKATTTHGKVDKRYVAEYLGKKYGEGVRLNLRANETKTGLPLADTHYVVKKDYSNPCFVYVYEVGETAMLLVKVDDEYGKALAEKHPIVKKSAFPKSKNAWYSVIVDDGFTEKEVEAILDAAYAMNGGQGAPAGVSLKESLAAARATRNKAERTKQGIAEYLTAEFAGAVEVNTRANKTKTGLPLADTHYAISERGKKCFVYVYEIDATVVLLLRLPEDYAAKLMKDHATVKRSAFPKAKVAWYSVILDDTFADVEVNAILKTAHDSVLD